MDIPIDKPLVLVTWLDAKDGQTGWHSIDDIEKEKLGDMLFSWLAHGTEQRESCYHGRLFRI
jgi:hypothetical protein